MVVVRVMPAAEALSPFAQVIGGYTRCDSIRFRDISQRVFHRLKAGLHRSGAAEWAAGAAAHGLAAAPVQAKTDLCAIPINRKHNEASTVRPPFDFIGKNKKTITGVVSYKDSVYCQVPRCSGNTTSHHTIKRLGIRRPNRLLRFGARRTLPANRPTVTVPNTQEKGTPRLPPSLTAPAELTGPDVSTSVAAIVER